MKNVFQSIFIFLFFLPIASAQVVDESINGVQIGYLGIWWNNESKIAHRWAIRTELGYEAPLFALTEYEIKTIEFQEGQYPLFKPVISIEPRWYYNSKKRQGNSKNTFHNSGNYATIAFRYYPEFLSYSPRGVNEAENGLFIIPTWGMRRNINYRWNFEIGIGAGFDVIDGLRNESFEENVYLTNKGILFNIHLRIGYKYGIQE